MNELNKLDQIYRYATAVCDPIDFAQRQKNLMYAICDFLLKPLNDIKENENKETGEAIEKFFKKDEK
jgi:hypothetical protein